MQELFTLRNAMSPNAGRREDKRKAAQHDYAVFTIASLGLTPTQLDMLMAFRRKISCRRQVAEYVAGKRAALPEQKFELLYGEPQVEKGIIASFLAEVVLVAPTLTDDDIRRGDACWQDLLLLHLHKQHFARLQRRREPNADP